MTWIAWFLRMLAAAMIALAMWLLVNPMCPMPPGTGSDPTCPGPECPDASVITDDPGPF